MKNLVLTGFMGTGKTTLAQAVAERLGRPCVDMDAVIAQRAGKPIARIFEEEGEAAFRAMEAALCSELAAQDGLVIATGGGALMDPQSRALMAENGTLICLQADVDEILRRVGNNNDRPLLEGTHPRASVERLLAHRQHVYATIPWQLPTTGRDLDDLVDEVVALADVRTLKIAYPTGQYDIHVGNGIRTYLGGALRAAGVSAGSRIALVSNDVVAPLYADEVRAILTSAGFTTTVCVLPDGEAHKTLATVRQLYADLLAADMDRRGTVLALGGGVTGDIAGFAAATYMRGVRFVQMPTTLLAMTDASVGGKTGVDLAQGKNLVGAFKQPALVLIDLDVLNTLPDAEMRSGMAELIKHSVIADPTLFEQLAAELQEDRMIVTPEIMARSLQVKIDIVEEDPFESGRRAVLNLGHTTAHALEQLSGYTLRHGEAVAIGMVAAARIAEALGRADAGLTERLGDLLGRVGLPTRCPPWPAATIMAAMRHDKKRQGQRLRWVLPVALGEVGIVDDVPSDLVHQVLLDMGAVAEL